MGEPSSSWQNFNFRDDEGSAQGMQTLRLLLAKLQEAQANSRLKPSVNNLLMTEDLMLTSTQRLPSSVAPMHLEGGEGVPVMHGPMQANVVPHPLQGPLPTDGAKKKQYHGQERHVGKIREEGDFHDDDDEPPSRSRHKKRTNEQRTKRSRRNSSGGSSSSSQSGRSSHGRFPKKEEEDILRTALPPKISAVKAQLLGGHDHHQMQTTGANQLCHLLHECWRIHKVLGCGGCGILSLALDLNFGREFIVKSVVCCGNDGNDTSRLPRRNNNPELDLDNEFTMLQRLRGCPHALECLGCDTDVDEEGHPVKLLFLKYMDAGSLSNVVIAHAQQFFARSILEDMQELHQPGVVHGDIKCANVLLRHRNSSSSSGLLNAHLSHKKKPGAIKKKGMEDANRFKVKLGDFGLSRVYDQRYCCMSHGHHTMRGTYSHMAPEVAEGGVEPASDVWSLGCTIVEMVQAVGPWGIGEEALLRQWLAEPPQIPSYLSKLQRLYPALPGEGSQRPGNRARASSASILAARQGGCQTSCNRSQSEEVACVSHANASGCRDITSKDMRMGVRKAMRRGLDEIVEANKMMVIALVGFVVGYIIIITMQVAIKAINISS
ncbi:hypothetical protein L7F22_004275 [Adiantum nelumboides]|nr:hypothetical protein [Adiantum nelumboides]